MGGTGGHKEARRRGIVSYQGVQRSPYGGGGDVLSLKEEHLVCEPK